MLFCMQSECPLFFPCFLIYCVINYLPDRDILFLNSIVALIKSTAIHFQELTVLMSTAEGSNYSVSQHSALRGLT